MTHNVSLDTLNQLPLLGIGTANSGTSGVRNPYNSLQTLPGVSSYASSGQFTLNGLGGNMTETMRVEGQDATSRLFGTYDYTQMGQPSADSIQEVAFQTSNYSAEFGQAGSVVINMTMKSGTNQYHGTGYDYFVNEDLNAGNPFSASTPSAASTGPVTAATISVEPWAVQSSSRNSTTARTRRSSSSTTNSSWRPRSTDSPTPCRQPHSLKGDFSGDLSERELQPLRAHTAFRPVRSGADAQLDALGRPMFANEIYDPLTRAVNPTNNLGYANPFPNNIIPLTRFDPVAQKIAALFPAPSPENSQSASATTARTSPVDATRRFRPSRSITIFPTKTSCPSSIRASTPRARSPLRWATRTACHFTIGAYRGTFIPTYTTSLNYDRTLSADPLAAPGRGLLSHPLRRSCSVHQLRSLHLWAFGLRERTPVPELHRNLRDPHLELPPAPVTAECRTSEPRGQIQTLNYEEKPSFTANLTWVHGNHTIKGGAELYLEQVFNGSFAGVTLNTGATTGSTGVGATAQPFTPTASFNGFTQGFGYANFLLGDYTSTAQTPQLNYRQGNQEWGVFIQDTWKVTRKLTLDYGIRWDLSTTYKEQYGRLGQFDPNLANANAGGHPGATIYASTCNCQFYQPIYPYAVGPRLGVAYQLNPKTVLRGGFGVNYQFINATAGGIVTTNGAYPLAGHQSLCEHRDSRGHRSSGLACHR